MINLLTNFLKKFNIYFVPAIIAQLDRAFGYEPKGRGFESLWLHQKTQNQTWLWVFFVKTGIRTER